MKKRIFILTLIAMLISTGFVWAAGNDEGEDAHSPSMSTESGEEPIEDMSTTKDPGVVDIEDGEEPDAGDEEVDAAEEELEESLDEAAEDTEDEELIANIPMKTAAIAGGVVLVLLILILILVSRSRKKKKEYVGKHGKK